MTDTLIIDCESAKTPLIEQSVIVTGRQVTVAHWHSVKIITINQYRALIISGGPHLFTDSKQALMDVFSFIPSLAIPTLGICLGGQAIALALGGDIYRGKERRYFDTMNIHQPHTLFQTLPSGTAFKEDHCEGIHPSGNMTVLASSEHYPVEAFAAKDKPLLGVQFHPESSGASGQQLISNFLSWAEMHKAPFS